MRKIEVIGDFFNWFDEELHQYRLSNPYGPRIILISISNYYRFCQMLSYHSFGVAADWNSVKYKCLEIISSPQIKEDEVRVY